MNNTGITLVDVRKEAMDAIRKLKSGDIDVKTAGAIKDLLNHGSGYSQNTGGLYPIDPQYNKRPNVCE